MFNKEAKIIDEQFSSLEVAVTKGSLPTSLKESHLAVSNMEISGDLCLSQGKSPTSLKESHLAVSDRVIGGDLCIYIIVFVY